eukprot:GILJ01006691.1.p1 GENE.GILJ01006691.1~~GILJ01006691.1.p1  ORF type:complete len:1125 (+),score=212.68 GILJ01006691.1:105-3479(+)
MSDKKEEPPKLEEPPKAPDPPKEDAAPQAADSSKPAAETTTPAAAAAEEKKDEGPKTKLSKRSKKEPKDAKDFEEFQKQRLFDVKIRNVKVTNHTAMFDPFVRFTVGGTQTLQERKTRGGKTVQKIGGKEGKSFKTEVQKAVVRSRTAEYKLSNFACKWRGSYHDLKQQNLSIEVWDWNQWDLNDFVARSEILLEDIAKGDISQVIEIRTEKNSISVSMCTVSFLCLFQEIVHFRLSFFDWSGMDLRGMDRKKDGTMKSDPFIVIKMRRTGFNKWKRNPLKTKSHPVYDTACPRWEKVGVIEFIGTLSELENEFAQIKVYDYDRFTKNELIGSNQVPLKGILEYNFMKTDLGYREKIVDATAELTGKKSKQGKKTEIRSGGLVYGSVNIEPVPQFRQTGSLVQLHAKRMYLIVKVVRAENLIAMDVSGVCDPFVTVEWDRTQQSTRVVEDTLRPVWNEELIFQVRLLNDHSKDNELKNELQKKGPVKVNVWDADAESNKPLGETLIALHEITEVVGTTTKTFLDFKETVHPYDTKVLVTKRRLNVEGASSQNPPTVHLEVWFLKKDLDPLMRLEPPQKKADFSEEQQAAFTKDEESFKSAIAPFEKPNRKFIYMAFDQNKEKHFLPLFLTAITPPKQLNTTKKLLHFVSCMAFEGDKKNKDPGMATWNPPDYFVTARKGGPEEHSVLLGSMLLGMRQKAFVCKGTTKHGQEHVWVMTQDFDGTVIFWETTNGRQYKMPGRWKGDGRPKMAQQEDDNRANEAKAKRIAEAKAKKMADAKAKEEAKAQQGDSKGGSGQGGSDSGAGALGGDGDTGGDEVVDDSLVILSEETLLREVDDMGVNEGEALASRFGLDLYLSPSEMDLTSQKKAIIGNRGPSRMDLARAKAEVDSKLSTAPVSFPGPPVLLPYATIEIIFDDQNLWGNLQNADPTKILYNLDNPERWHPFFTIPKKLDPFYTPKTMGPPMSEDRARLVKSRILDELTQGFTTARTAASLPTKWVKDRDFVSNLEAYLQIQEDKAISDSTSELNACLAREGEWASKTTNNVCPGGFKFEGLPIHFAKSDPELIRKAILARFKYHRIKTSSVIFAVACKVVPYSNNVLSVWIYMAYMYPAGESIEYLKDDAV